MRKKDVGLRERTGQKEKWVEMYKFELFGRLFGGFFSTLRSSNAPFLEQEGAHILVQRFGAALRVRVRCSEFAISRSILELLSIRFDQLGQELFD
jgi:hypothetical protein